MKWKWTIALCLILIADSFFTIFIGEEASSIILWVMNIFNLSLETTMYLRLLYLAPLVWIVHKWNYIRFVTVAYVNIYISQSIFMYMLHGGMII
jgi:hypothetical protein